MFANPAYWFALAGLAIPVVIHFLSRKEGKVIKLGSVRHVVETSTQQFKGIKLNELILLALRCAMIVLFSLLLSGLRCSNQGKEKWAIVEKGLIGLPHMRSILDSLKKEGHSLHLLAHGFPGLQDSSAHSPDVNYWQLVEELKTKNLSSAVVFSANHVGHFKGMRAALPSHIQWMSQPTPSIDFAVRAIRYKGDSAFLRRGHSASDKTYFTTKKIRASESPMATTLQDSIKISLVSDVAFAYDQKIVKTALQTIEKFLNTKIILTENELPNLPRPPADWCIWLSLQKADRTIAENIIRFDPQSSTDLFEREGSRQWTITKRLNLEVAAQNNLAMQLARLILPKHDSEMVARNDRRTLSDSLAWRHSEDVKDIRASIDVPADPYLIVLLITLFVAERILAYKRRQ